MNWSNAHRDGIQDFRPWLGRRPVFESFPKGQRVEPFPIGLDLWNPPAAPDSAQANGPENVIKLAYHLAV